jgi:hemolysin activation/secretion protein
MKRRLPALLMAAALWGGTLSTAGAQDAPLQLRFDIADYRVEGNSLLSRREIERVLAPFRGRARDFGDVQRAVEALEGAYRKAGYAAVQVYLPEQELNQGVVVLRVLEARIGSVRVSGNQHFDRDNIRRSVPALQEGLTPSAPRIADNTQLANENPAKKVRVVLRPSGKPNEADAVIEVEDEKPWRAFVNADNTGTEQTGRYRTGVGLQHNNLFNRDHTITAQYITSPEYPSQVSIYSVGYRVPIYSLGDSIDLIAGHSDVDVGTTQTQAGPLSFTGKGYVAAARYNWLLPRRGEYEHRFIFGADYRVYDNACSVGTLGTCGAAGTDVTVHPLSLTYSGTNTRARSQVAFYATALHNIPGGKNGGEEELQAARHDADADYNILRAGVSLAVAWWRDFQARARIDAQYTDAALIPGEQFGIGGWNSVRGFLEREIANDRGYSGSVELYTPDLARASRLTWGELRLLAFYDLGEVYRNRAQPGETTNVRVSSAGAGVRMGIKKNFSLRADVASVIDEGGSQGAGDVRVHVGVLLSF